MDKKEIRQDIKAKKNKLNKSDIDNMSLMISDKFVKLKEYKDTDKLFIYMSYNQEVNTKFIIKDCFEHNKSVYVPRVISKDCMKFYKISSFDDLEDGYMGIPEPSINCEESINNNGLMVMPGLAFDFDKHRIGYGGGFYDRFLSDNPDFVKVALCFDFQIYDHIPYEEHDYKPDVIISEKRILN